MPLFGTHMKFPFVFPFIISSCTRTKKRHVVGRVSGCEGRAESLSRRKPHDLSPTVSNWSYSQMHTKQSRQKITTSAGTPNTALQPLVFPHKLFEINFNTLSSGDSSVDRSQRRSEKTAWGERNEVTGWETRRIKGTHWRLCPAFQLCMILCRRCFSFFLKP